MVAKWCSIIGVFILKQPPICDENMSWCDWGRNVHGRGNVLKCSVLMTHDICISGYGVNPIPVLGGMKVRHLIQNTSFYTAWCSMHHWFTWIIMADVNCVIRRCKWLMQIVRSHVDLTGVILKSFSFISRLLLIFLSSDGGKLIPDDWSGHLHQMVRNWSLHLYIFPQ